LSRGPSFSALVNVWGIVVAAGSGNRFGGAKHAAELAGRPLWQWAAGLLEEAGVTGVVLVGDVPGGVAGGARRQDSVAAGLSKVPGSADIVLIHDAARPLASSALVRRLLGALTERDVAGAVPGLPLTDTIKRVADGMINGTLERSGLVAVQTPQAFRADILRKAHREVTSDVTDDAAMVEAIGGTVVLVEGDPANLKVTFRADLVMAESLLDAGRQR